MAFFIVFFAIASGAGIVTLPIYVKVALAVVLVGAYAYYVRLTIQSGGESEGDEPQDLILWRSGSPAPTWVVALQAVGSVTVIAVAAHYFVTAIEHLSEDVGIPAGLIALVLAPLATELFEKFNSIIWVRDGKDTLAFGNISGAIVFQSTIPVTLGLLFTRWQLNSLNVLAVGLALASGALFYMLLRGKRSIRAPVGGGTHVRRLRRCGGPYRTRMSPPRRDPGKMGAIVVGATRCTTKKEPGGLVCRNS